MSDTNIFETYLSRDDFHVALNKVCVRVDKKFMRRIAPAVERGIEVCPSCGDISELDEVNGWCRPCVKASA